MTSQDVGSDSAFRMVPQEAAVDLEVFPLAQAAVERRHLRRTVVAFAMGLLALVVVATVAASLLQEDGARQTVAAVDAAQQLYVSDVVCTACEGRRCNCGWANAENCDPYSFHVGSCCWDCCCGGGSHPHPHPPPGENVFVSVVLPIILIICVISAFVWWWKQQK
mmetsp:Transcript_90937/g.262010  ORF Transcript_90937/g.262010 Transcript_90937/m.262010 type:complete len:165 (+) Transcript_90937:68-562(+)